MAGRPTSFKPEFVEQAQKLAALGATDREAAEFFNVVESTLYLWKHTQPEFSEALKVGKDAADERVVQSLYRKAVGYSFDAVKMHANDGVVTITPYVEHVPPSDTAAIFWLKNRRGDEWRDKSEVNNTHELSEELAEWLGLKKSS
jgi:hypothetical protein